MKINIVIDGELIDREDDAQINVDSDPNDTIEDIMIKATFAISGLEINKAQLNYKNRILERDE